TYQSSNYWVDVVFVSTGSGGSGPAQSVTVLSGSSQSTTIGTAFSSALQAKVTDGSSNPIPGIVVTFTSPASRARLSFDGSNSVTPPHNRVALAASPVPVANNTSGTFNVIAPVPGLTPATFTLTNTNSSTGGTTTIFGTAAPSATFNAGSQPV